MWLKTILIFSFLMISVATVSSQPILVPSDNVSWAQVSETNVSYNNWTIYTRTIDRDESQKSFKVYIENFPGGKFQAKWKATKIGVFGNVTFFINGEKRETLKKEDIADYTWIGKDNPFIVKRNDTLWLELSSFKKGGKIYIAFPGNVTQPPSPNSVPEQPEILSGPDKGYNNSSIAFSVKSNDPDGDRLNYIFDWGNGSNSTIGPFGSGEIATINHDWTSAGVYEIKVTANDGKNNSTPSQPKKIKISWLVKALPGSPLQHVINKLKSNSTLLLEGKDYAGPIDIININHINILSNNSSCNITSNKSDNNYTIGLELANNITINKINITNGLKSIGLHNCTYCNILNNNISFRQHGIDMVGGHDNTIERNYLKGIDINDSDNNRVGISLEDTWQDTIVCNNIKSLNEIGGNSHSEYYIRNSTFKKFKVFVPSSNITIIKYDQSEKIGISGDKVHCIYDRNANKFSWYDNSCNPVNFNKVIVEKCE